MKLKRKTRNHDDNGDEDGARNKARPPKKRQIDLRSMLGMTHVHHTSKVHHTTSLALPCVTRYCFPQPRHSSIRPPTSDSPLNSHTLNAEQAAAAHADIHRPLLIVAGAGSGKTTVVVERICHMVLHHVGVFGVVVVEHTQEIMLPLYIHTGCTSVQHSGRHLYQRYCGHIRSIYLL